MTPELRAELARLNDDLLTPQELAHCLDSLDGLEQYAHGEHDQAKAVREHIATLGTVASRALAALDAAGQERDEAKSQAKYHCHEHWMPCDMERLPRPPGATQAMSDPMIPRMQQNLAQRIASTLNVRSFNAGGDVEWDAADIQRVLSDLKLVVVEREAVDRYLDEAKSQVAALVEALRKCVYTLWEEWDDQSKMVARDEVDPLLADLAPAAAARDKRITDEATKTEAARWRRMPGSYRTPEGGLEVIVDVPESASFLQDEFPDEVAKLQADAVADWLSVNRIQDAIVASRAPYAAKGWTSQQWATALHAAFLASKDAEHE
jgi:hypothetical protein